MSKIGKIGIPGILLLLSITVLIWWFFPRRQNPLQAVSGSAIWVERQAGKKGIPDDPLVQEFFQAGSDTAVVTSLHRTGAQRFEKLWVLPGVPEEMMETLSLKQGVRRSSFEGKTILEWDSPGGLSLALALEKGLALLSTRPLLVEQALLALEQDTPEWSFEGDGGYRWMATGNSLFTYLSACLKPPGDSLAKTFLSSLDKLQAIAGKGELRFSKKVNPFFKEGVLSPAALLPSNTFLFLYFSTDLFSSPHSDNRKVDLSEGWKEEAGLLWTEALSEEESESIPVVLLRSQQEDAAAFAEEWREKAGLLESRNYLGFELSHILIGGISFPGKEDLLGDAAEAWMTTIGDFVFLSPSPDALKKWADHYLSGRMLTGLFPESSGDVVVQFYLNPDRAGLHLRRYFTEECMEEGRPGHFLKKTGPRTGLLKREEGKYHFSLKEEKRAAAEEGPLTLWQQTLDAPLQSGPLAVGNPEKGWHIIIQDESGGLHCMRQDGGESWHKDLDGPLLALERFLPNVGRDDVFLYQLPNEVGRMEAGDARTLQLISPSVKASGPLCLLSTSGGHPRGFLFPAKNGLLYGYDLEGRPLDGWPVEALSGQEVQKFLHWRSAEAEEILAVTSAGALYGFDRRGEPAFGPLALGDSLLAGPLLGSGGRLFYLSSAGELRVLFLRPEGRPLGPEVWARNVSTFFTDPAFEALYYLQGESLIIENLASREKRAVPLSVPSPESLSLLPLSVPGSGQAWISALDTKEKEVYLFDSDGTPVPGFPTSATRPPALIDLEGDGRPEVVLGFEEFVFLVRLNG